MAHWTSSVAEGPEGFRWPTPGFYGYHERTHVHVYNIHSNCHNIYIYIVTHSWHYVASLWVFSVSSNKLGLVPLLHLRWIEAGPAATTCVALAFRTLDKHQRVHPKRGLLQNSPRSSSDNQTVGRRVIPWAAICGLCWITCWWRSSAPSALQR